MVRLTPDGTNPPRLESVITTTTRRRSMKKKRRRILPRADINVTPFIDILLVLLVIFMTISPTERTGLNAAIPQPPPPGPAQPQENVVVLSMDRNGVIRINQDEVVRIAQRRSSTGLAVRASSAALSASTVPAVRTGTGPSILG